MIDTRERHLPPEAVSLALAKATSLAKRLYGTAPAHGPWDAEDLVQDALLRACRQWDAEKGTSFVTYVCNTVGWVWMERQRGAAREYAYYQVYQTRRQRSATTEALQGDPSTILLNAEAARFPFSPQQRGALARLSRKAQQYIRALVNGETANEIARAHGVTPAVVYQATGRLRKALRLREAQGGTHDQEMG